MPEEVRFPRAMGEEDAFLWRMERNPILRSTAAAITVLDRAPERGALRAKLRCAAREIPRLRQRVVELPALVSTPVWARDPYFDLDYHLRFVRAPGDGSFQPLLDLASALAMQGFDTSRPLWEFVVVEDLARGRAALIQKLHHAVTDGVGGILLMRRVYDDARSPPPAGDAALPEEGDGGAEGTLRLGTEAVWRALARRPGIARRRAGRALHAARHPLDAIHQGVSDLRSVARFLTPARAPLSPIMQRRSTSYRYQAFGVPFERLRGAGRAAGCRLNDAFLASLTGGWRRYHERHGSRPRELRVQLPISVRSAEPSVRAGNQLMLARFALPLDVADPRDRMRAIRSRVAAERAQPVLRHVETVAGALNLLPDALLVGLGGVIARSVDFIASCVPGPGDPLYMAGARVESLFTFGPLAGAAANVTLFRYCDSAEIAINADPAAAPDHDALAACMREGFDEVLKLA